VQTATTQYQGQLADSLKNATQQLKSQFESGLESFKQQINESYYSYKNASDGIKACLEEQEEKYTEVYNSTRK
jgi:DNA repair ATPase RecN